MHRVSTARRRRVPSSWLVVLCIFFLYSVQGFIPSQTKDNSKAQPSLPWRIFSSSSSSSSSPASSSPPSPPPPSSKPKRMTITEQLKLSPNRWKRNGRSLEPGVGGIWPGRPDARKYKVTVVDPKTGTNHTMDIPEDRYVYWAFEEEGIDLPFHNAQRMCRNGCCTVCAVKITEGKVKMEAALGLLRDLKSKGYALTCCSLPRSDIVCEMQNEDEVYIKQWGETFEGGGVDWGGFLPEDD